MFTKKASKIFGLYFRDCFEVSKLSVSSFQRRITMLLSVYTFSLIRRKIEHGRESKRERGRGNLEARLSSMRDKKDQRTVNCKEATQYYSGLASVFSPSHIFSGQKGLASLFRKKRPSLVADKPKSQEAGRKKAEWFKKMEGIKKGGDTFRDSTHLKRKRRSSHSPQRQHQSYYIREPFKSWIRSEKRSENSQGTS